MLKTSLSGRARQCFQIVLNTWLGLLDELNCKNLKVYPGMLVILKPMLPDRVQTGKSFTFCLAFMVL